MSALRPATDLLSPGWALLVLLAWPAVALAAAAVRDRPPRRLIPWRGSVPWASSTPASAIAPPASSTGPGTWPSQASEMTIAAAGTR